MSAKAMSWLMISDRSGLRDDAFRVMVYVCDRYAMGMGCLLDDRTLGRFVGSPPARVATILGALEADGLVRLVRRAGPVARVIVLPCDPAFAEVFE